MPQAEAQEYDSFLVEPVDETPSVVGMLRRASSSGVTSKSVKLRKVVLQPKSTGRSQAAYKARVSQQRQARTMTALRRSGGGRLRVSPAQRALARRHPASVARREVVQYSAPQPPAVTTTTHEVISIPSVRPVHREKPIVYLWLVLITVFLLAILGGIGLDALLATYH